MLYARNKIMGSLHVHATLILTDAGFRGLMSFTLPLTLSNTNNPKKLQ